MQLQLEQIEYRLKSRLNQLPPREVRTGRDLIRRMLPEIEAGLAKGYSLFDLHLVLANDGLPFSFETFRRYYREEKAAAAYHANQQQPSNSSSLKEQPQEHPPQPLSPQVPIANTTTELTTPESTSDSVSQEALRPSITIPNTESTPVSRSAQQQDNRQATPPKRQNQPRAQSKQLTSTSPAKFHQKPGSSSSRATSVKEQNLPIPTPPSPLIEERAQPPPQQIEQSKGDVPFPEIQFGMTWVDQSQYFNKY